MKVKTNIKKTADTCGMAVFFVIVGVFLAAGLGYFMNFQNLFEYAAEQTEFTLSLIGVFVTPLGCVTGWIY